MEETRAGACQLRNTARDHLAQAGWRAFPPRITAV